MRNVIAGLVVIVAAALFTPGAGAMKPPSGRAVMVIGHRGASGYAPENTMAAFRMAKEMGADMVELDVYHSADGALVVMHDDTVDRTTDGRGEIEKMTLEEIRKLDAGLKFQEKYKGEKVPTLEEVLAWAGENKMLVNIEIKGAGCEENIIALLRKYKMVDKTIVTSFHHDYIAKIRELEPEVEIGALVRDIEDILAIVEACRPNAINPRYIAVNKKQVDETHKLGMAVNVYTVNDALTMRMMMRHKVDGIITNNPDVLAALVDKKKRGPDESK